MRNWSKDKEKQMKAVNKWCGYYRANPHRFVEEYLNFKLKTFQCILLVMMNVCTRFTFIASRGIGKSLLAAIFCCQRCILYPNTQICIAAGSKEQSAEIIGKIQLMLMPRSPLLRNEIADYKNNTSGAYIIFKNGSYIKTVTASDNARHNRANILISLLSDCIEIYGLNRAKSEKAKNIRECLLLLKEEQLRNSKTYLMNYMGIDLNYCPNM